MTLDDYKNRILDVEKRLHASRETETITPQSARALYFELQQLVRAQQALGGSKSHQ